MDLLREFHQLWTFRLLAEDLAGRLSVETLADHLSALGDLLLQVALEQAWAQMLTRHREQPQFAIIAYGKLGGKELGYASDLDIIFVYDDQDERAPDIYARLAQRLINWLTSHTSAGRLFNVDLRLRPNGNAGLLVSSIEALAQYQLGQGSNAAWLWEHQALTRARFAAGDVELGARFEQLRRDLLALPRGTRLSLFPMGPVQGDSEGLRWPLAGLDFAPDGMIGTSNEVSGAVRLRMHAPKMLVILPVRYLQAALHGCGLQPAALGE
jgi:glutamate-ammonia-ligase adenylyltransferase